MSAEKKKVHILSIGLEVKTEDLLGSIAQHCDVTAMPCDPERLMEPFDPPADLILCGFPKSLSPNELAQLLRMQNPDIPIFFVCLARAGYDRKIFVKNGFSDAFILPMDTDFLKRAIHDYVAKVSDGTLTAYRPVKLIDIQPGVSLDFDTTIYLPANNKYIKYSVAGDPLDEARIKRLSQHKMSSLYVTTDQMPKFYQYSAKRLAELGNSSNLSETEKKEKLETSIRDLMSGIFNDTAKDASFEQGKSLVNDCQEIVKAYILGSENGDWYKRLLSAMGELGTSYSHPANVATYASLFSIGLQIGDPTELAMAGLLHDIGLSDVPHAILLKPENQRTPEERAEYEKHPQHSVNIIKARRLVMPETVMKMILQHHECFNGTGFPEHLHGDRIAKQSQVLSLADRFDELTGAVEGKPLMSAVEAIHYFKSMLVNDPSKMIFDPELLKKALGLFPQN